MNDAQLKAVRQVLLQRLPLLDRYHATALALEVIEAVENKATPKP